MSQAGLAALVGITFQQIQKYEAGSNRVAASRLFAIARVLEVPLTYFFESIGDAPPAGKANRRPAPKRASAAKSRPVSR